LVCQFSFVTTVSADEVLEGNGELVPSRLVLGDLHANEISEPDDVLDLELLELEIGEEDTEVESVLEGHGVSTGGLIKDDIVDGCFSIHGFVALVLVEVGGGEHGLVVSAI
jgi:hypothetical protein